MAEGIGQCLDGRQGCKAPGTSGFSMRTLITNLRTLITNNMRTLITNLRLMNRDEGEGGD